MLFMLKLSVAELQKKPNALNSMLLQLAVLRNYFFFFFLALGEKKEKEDVRPTTDCTQHRKLSDWREALQDFSSTARHLPSLDFLICTT